MKQSTGSSKKISKRLTKTKRKKTQINNIRHEAVDITTEHVSIRGKIREHYKELEAHKFHSLEQKQFLENHKLPKFKQAEIGILNGLIPLKKTEYVI